MADIMITLSANSDVYTGSIIGEANWAKTDGPLWYPLPTKPLHAQQGCRIYFILAGRMVGRATIQNIESKTWKGPTHKGIILKHKGPAVEYSDIDVASKNIEHLGFQGYRYVQGALLRKFEKSFNPK